MAVEGDLIFVPSSTGGDVGHAIVRRFGYRPSEPGGDVGQQLSAPQFEHYVETLRAEEAITIDLVDLDERAIQVAHDVADRHRRSVVLRRIEPFE